MPAAGENLSASVLSVGLPFNNSPLFSNAIGTPSTGTTEVFDVVLGYYQAFLILGHWYRVVIDGLIGNSGATADNYLLQIRNSQSSSNPTTSSTSVASTMWFSPGVGTLGRTNASFSMPFQCVSGGFNTFGFSSQRITGSSVFSPVGNRALYVEDMGGN